MIKKSKKDKEKEECLKAAEDLLEMVKLHFADQHPFVAAEFRAIAWELENGYLDVAHYGVFQLTAKLRKKLPESVTKLLSKWKLRTVA